MSAAVRESEESSMSVEKKKKNIEGWMKFQGPGEVYLDVVRFVFSW